MSVMLRLLFVIVMVSAGSLAAAQQIISQEFRRFGLGTLEEAVLSPDGRFIVSVGGGGAFVWEAETGLLLREIEFGPVLLGNPPRPVYSENWSAVFAPNGTQVFIGSSREARLFDLATGTLVQSYLGHDGLVWAIDVSQDGQRLITGSGDNKARVFDVASGSLLQVLEGHSDFVMSVALSADGTLAITGSWDTTARLWNSETGAEVQRWNLRRDVHAVGFSPDGSTVAAGLSNDEIVLMNSDTGEETRRLDADGNTASGTRSIAFLADNERLLTAHSDDLIRLWNWRTGDLLRSYEGHSNWVTAVSASSAGDRFATASDDATVRYWDIAQPDALSTIDRHTAAVRTVDLSPDGRWLLSAHDNDRGIYLWNVASGGLRAQFPSSSGFSFSARFFPDGSRFIGHTGGQSATIWDLETLEPLATLQAGYDNLRVSSDGNRLVSSLFNDILILDSATGEQLLRIVDAHEENLCDLAWSPDGQQIASASFDGLDGGSIEAKVWDAATGQLLVRLGPHKSILEGVNFSPDGRKVITSDFRSLYIWNSSTGELLEELKTGLLHGPPAWSPAGDFVASGSEDIRVLSTDPLTTRTLYQGHRSWNNDLQFSADGKLLATGSDDGTIRLWPVSVREAEKVLIVAGGGNYVGNAIAEETRALAEQAFLASLIRGISAEDIQYLSSFDAPAENPRVDGPATVAAVDDAIVNWADDARRLTVILLDHGETQFDTDLVPPEQNEWYFYVDASVFPREVLSATAFDAMLDRAQENGLAELAVIVDMCFAGGFIRRASSAPEGYERAILASTTDDRLANFGGSRSGSHSFTYYLMSELIKGSTLLDAHRTAREAVSNLRVPASAPQLPWLDDNGDGLATLQDGALAARMVLGNNPPFGALAPELLAVPSDTTLTNPQPLRVEIQTGPGRVDGAEATLVWSGADYPGGLPITDLTVVPLVPAGNSGTWAATIPASAFPGAGSYNILFAAYRADPLSEEIRFSSNVMTQTVTVGSVTPTPTPSGEQRVRRALLGSESTQPGDDRNGDGVLDAGDLLQ